MLYRLHTLVVSDILQHAYSFWCAVNHECHKGIIYEMEILDVGQLLTVFIGWKTSGVVCMASSFDKHYKFIFCTAYWLY